MQTGLDLRMIKDAVLFATRHKREASQVRENCSRAVLAVEPQQGLFRQELLRREVARDGGKRLSQFLSVAPVAFVAKTAEPLEAVGLADDRARPYHLPALAPSVARSTHLIQPAKGLRQVFRLRQRPLPSGFTRAINVENNPRVVRSIHQTSDLLFMRERATEQIIEKEGAQGFNGRFSQRCQKAREGRAGGELVTVK